MCRSSVGIDLAMVLDRVTWIGVEEVGAPGSRYTRIPLGATPVYCSTLTTTSFSAASIASHLSLKLENLDEMNLVLLIVKPTRLLARMLTLSQRQICF